MDGCWQEGLWPDGRQRGPEWAVPSESPRSWGTGQVPGGGGSHHLLQEVRELLSHLASGEKAGEGQSDLHAFLQFLPLLNGEFGVLCSQPHRVYF